MTDTVPETGSKRPRIELIDVLRAAALVAMAIYHFTWDLDFHGYVPRGLANQGGWRLFARCIASSFLFLVGVSLVLAHARGIRWRSFSVREAQVTAGALAITVATFFVTPGSFVFFGILHQIAVASLIGLLFVRLPPVLTLVAGAATIALPLMIETSLTEPKWLAWIGIAARQPVTNDYVPVFPWTGVVLFGIAAANLVDRHGGWTRLAALNKSLGKLHPLAALGRHSLLFYLLHQPILFGLVAGYAFFFPPDPAVQFAGSCRQECGLRANGPTCRAYCDCVQNRLQADDLLRRLLAGTTTDDENQTIRQAALRCSFENPPDGRP